MGSTESSAVNPWARSVMTPMARALRTSSDSTTAPIEVWWRPSSAAVAQIRSWKRVRSWVSPVASNHEVPDADPRSTSWVTLTFHPPRARSSSAAWAWGSCLAAASATNSSMRRDPSPWTFAPRAATLRSTNAAPVSLSTWVWEAIRRARQPGRVRSSTIAQIRGRRWTSSMTSARLQPALTGDISNARANGSAANSSRPWRIIPGTDHA
ncbi:hypothetical protein ASF50_03165 [Nocardioides sp. Leaf307]|nr:hypothetical protein ASF50_03165 [Nocardioides sp. Leaf307]